MISVIGFFLVATYTRLTSIESEMLQIRLDIARMHIPSNDEIKEICRLEIFNNERGKSTGKVPQFYYDAAGSACPQPAAGKDAVDR